MTEDALLRRNREPWHDDTVPRVAAPRCCGTAARGQCGQTLEDVARGIPTMDAKYLGEIERGWHAPTIVTVKRIADALGITVSELVTDL